MRKYCVGYKVEGRYYAYVEAESVDEAREKAKEEFYDADFGELVRYRKLRYRTDQCV